MRKLTIQRLKRLAEVISQKKGGLHFLGVFKREDIPDSWDLLVSADQLPPRSREALGFVGDMMKKYLKRPDLVRIARIVLLPPNHGAINDLLRLGQPADEALADEYPSSRLDHGVVIFSDKPAARLVQPA